MISGPLTSLVDFDAACPKIAVFRYLDDGDWEVFKLYLDQARYAAGDILYNEGDTGDFLAFIVSGHLEALKKTKFLAKPVILARFYVVRWWGKWLFWMVAAAQ